MGISLALMSESLKGVSWASWAQPRELSALLGEPGALVFAWGAMLAMGAIFVWVGRRREE
jgi:hypothetical protein